ncbi:DAK2 domain-containing protein [Streptomyces sp. NPDC126499]
MPPCGRGRSPRARRRSGGSAGRPSATARCWTRCCRRHRPSVPPWAALRLAAEAAEKGAAATASLTPRLGRSSCLGERARGHPDPGATAVARWPAALAAYGDREE